MASLPKPLIALLVATVAVFALYTAVLKKTLTGSGSSSSSSPSSPALTSAIAKAHQAVTTANQASVAHGGTVAETPAPGSTATTPAAKAATKPATHPAKPSKDAQKAVATLKALAHGRPAKAASVNSVIQAIDSHKVVALLFYNPAAADDQAVKQELGGISTDRGQVVRFSVPVTDLAQFQAVTSKVPVTSTPTLLVIDKRGEASTLTGFVDELTISQTVADALGAR